MHSSFFQLQVNVYEYEDELLHQWVDIAEAVAGATTH